MSSSTSGLAIWSVQAVWWQWSSPDSAPVKRLVKEARERGMLIDASYGRSTRAVLIMDSDHVVLSALQPETVANRAAGQEGKTPAEEEQTHGER